MEKTKLTFWPTQYLGRIVCVVDRENKMIDGCQEEEEFRGWVEMVKGVKYKLPGTKIISGI